MLPLKIGFETVVRPRFWGFTLTPGVIAAYVALFAALAATAGRLWGWRAVVGVAAAGSIYYFGTVGTPWPLFMLAVPLLAYQVAGWRLALFAASALGFILITGAWPRAMLTLYITGAAVFISFLLGSAALVGTNGLGQLVYEGVTKANFGWGVVAGGSIALIAMVTDRILQAWSRRKKAEMGIA